MKPNVDSRGLSRMSAKGLERISSISIGDLREGESGRSERKECDVGGRD